MQTTTSTPTTTRAFTHYPNRPLRLTPELVDAEAAKILKQADQAEGGSGADGWIQTVQAWNSLEAYVRGENSRVHYKLAADRRDTAVEAEEKRLRETVIPRYEDFEFAVSKKVIASRHRPALEARFGKYYFERMEAGLTTLRPENSDLRVQASGLAQDYAKKIAMAEVKVGTETMSLSRARSLSTSADPETRKQSFFAHRQWFDRERGSIGGIFSQLVQLRQKMALNLGDKNFIPLGYAGMTRTEWNVTEADTFRELIRKHFVPVEARSSEQQALRLRSSTLLPWDSDYDPGFTLPDGVAPVGSQLDRAQKVFDKISPRLGGHFKRMREEGLIDLENRPGKQAGAFCTSFPDENKVAIFCNSTGQASDVGTLMHEAGHSFQGWESTAIELVSLQWPTMEAAEIHSMGMEYLSLAHMEEFFEPALAKKFARERWKKAVWLLCYCSIVDEFQHWVYANSAATPDERDRTWDRLWKQYLPAVDYSSCPELMSARWYAQMHVFHAPFYYLDYAIAEVCAMQLALMAAENPKRAVESYLELCRIGGTQGIQGICKSAGMSSPFDPALIERLAGHAARELG